MQSRPEWIGLQLDARVPGKEQATAQAQGKARNIKHLFASQRDGV